MTITATPDDPNAGQEWITWAVADTGIPAADRPHLFRRFYRASTALDRRIPGTGLGLVIARAIIERHGGTITLTDHQGPGVTFRIRAYETAGDQRLTMSFRSHQSGVLLSAKSNIVVLG
jgi:signal transduction histidine kinase